MSGALPDSPRPLCHASWPGLQLFVKEQDISRLTTWSIHVPDHVLIVHLGGPIHRLETELKGAGALLHPPLAGEAWVVPAQTRYSSLAQGKLVRYAELFLDPHQLSTVAGKQMEAPPVRARAGHYDDFLYRAVQHLQLLHQQSDDLARLSAAALSQSIYLHFFREHAQGTLAASPRNVGPRLLAADESRLREYIADRLGSTIRLGELAALVRMSSHQLLSAFRISFGTTPAQYILEQRLGRARWLLVTSRQDIASIAFESGFSSHGHLTTCFRKRFGVPPKEYRQNA